MHTIQTKYNGIWFRSKLEAQWAKFFDAHGIEYAYEPEGYYFSDGTYYLPDFYLFTCGCFFEVKGIVDDISLNKITNLARKSGKLCVVGEAGWKFFTLMCGYPVYRYNNYEEFITPQEINYHYSHFCRCSECGEYFFSATRFNDVCVRCAEDVGYTEPNNVILYGNGESFYSDNYWMEHSYIDPFDNKTVVESNKNG